LEGVQQTKNGPKNMESFVRSATNSSFQNFAAGAAKKDHALRSFNDSIIKLRN